jgi:hypothetical protein
LEEKKKKKKDKNNNKERDKRQSRTSYPTHWEKEERKRERGLFWCCLRGGLKSWEMTIFQEEVFEGTNVGKDLR